MSKEISKNEQYIIIERKERRNKIRKIRTAIINNLIDDEIYLEDVDHFIDDFCHKINDFLRYELKDTE